MAGLTKIQHNLLFDIPSLQEQRCVLLTTILPWVSLLWDWTQPQRQGSVKKKGVLYGGDLQHLWPDHESLHILLTLLVHLLILNSMLYLKLGQRGIILSDFKAFNAKHLFQTCSVTVVLTTEMYGAPDMTWSKKNKLTCGLNIAITCARTTNSWPRNKYTVHTKYQFVSTKY